MQRFITSSFLLRAALAFAFAYAALGGFLNPAAWIGFFPEFLFTLVPSGVALPLFGAGEFMLAVWLLSGWQTRIAAAVAAAMLASIAGFNLAQLDIVFRDIALALAALALARLPEKPQVQM